MGKTRFLTAVFLLVGVVANDFCLAFNTLSTACHKKSKAKTSHYLELASLAMSSPKTTKGGDDSRGHLCDEDPELPRWKIMLDETTEEWERREAQRIAPKKTFLVQYQKRGLFSNVLFFPVRLVGRILFFPFRRRGPRKVRPAKSAQADVELTRQVIMSASSNNEGEGTVLTEEQMAELINPKN